MNESLGRQFLDRIASLDDKSPTYVSEFVACMLESGVAAHASDLHLQPTRDGVELRWRIDGVLQLVGRWPKSIAPNLVSRLKVLADLLTYRTEVPQEGRIQDAPSGVEMRLSTFPTLYGEKAVVRIFAGSESLQRFSDLGLPEDVGHVILRTLGETAGALFVTGPAGSGKTTTIYACLRELAARTAGSRCLATLEDPIESALPGVVQSQVNEAAGFDLATGLRSILRQDPEVLLVGEIRDRATAEGVFQASLTGHLVLTTFHAGTAAEAISRLGDMGIEPYLLRSAVLAILCQRLVRRLCTCATPTTDLEQRLGLPVERCWIANGCDRCWGTGYRNRKVLAELLAPGHGELGRAILSRSDSTRLEKLAVKTGMITRWQRAYAAVENGETSPAEVRRVLGLGNPDLESPL